MKRILVVLLSALGLVLSTVSIGQAAIPKTPPSSQSEFDVNGHCWHYDGSDSWLTMTTNGTGCNTWSSDENGTNGTYEVYQNSNGKCLAWSTTRSVFQEETCSSNFSRSGQIFEFIGTSCDDVIITDNMTTNYVAQANGDGNPVISALIDSGCNGQQNWYAG